MFFPAFLTITARFEVVFWQSENNASTKKVIEKVRFHTKDVDLNSSITEKKLIFLSPKSGAKILNFACFLT